MVALAFFICIFLARYEARRQNINPEKIYDLAFFILISGLIGGRLLYVFLNLSYFQEHPIEIIMLQHGGLVWFGALGFALIASIIFVKKNKLPVLKTLDFIAPYVALGQAIGRIGCFLNGCCYGKISSWGIYFPVHGQILIPTQLFSSLYLIIIFLILRFYQYRTHKTGLIFFAYLGLYSIARFFIEFLRADTPSIFLGLSIFQIISIFLFISSVYAILHIKGQG
jgi:phosphatidylglycerol:prolipoprotein diacylglycerol transferase